LVLNLLLHEPLKFIREFAQLRVNGFGKEETKQKHTMKKKAH